jgi:hypothetical protein
VVKISHARRADVETNELSPTTHAIPVAQSAEEKVIQLVRLQSFDGSFTPSAPLQLILGAYAMQEAKFMNVSNKVWATVLAIAFLKKYMKDQPELLDGLVEKAMDFLSGSDVDLGALLAHAEKIVS